MTQNAINLKHIENINKLGNLLIDIFSYRISRDESKNITLKSKLTEITDLYNIINQNELLNEKNLEKEIIEPFITSFSQIKKLILKYKNNEQKSIDLNLDNTLNCFFVDEIIDEEILLATVYKYLIEWQNNVINLILEKGKNNKILRKYIPLMEKEILIQDATKNDIIYIDENTFEYFERLIKKTSNRDIFTKEGKIDYSNYYENIYDYEYIETELAKILLNGIKKFKEGKIKTIVYKYEEFSLNNNIINRYNKKYPKKTLSNEEYNLLNNLIKRNSNKKLYIDISYSLHIIMNRLLLYDYESNQLIYEFLNDFPQYIFLDKEFKFLLKSEYELNHKTFPINTLISIFEYFEDLYWEERKNNILSDYKKDLNENEKQRILDYFEKIENDETKIINEDIFIKGLRIFISRYLVNSKLRTEIKPQSNLGFFLERSELWEEEIYEKDLFLEELYDICYNDTKIENIYCLYNLLNEDIFLNEELRLNYEEEIFNIKNKSYISFCNREEDKELYEKLNEFFNKSDDIKKKRIKNEDKIEMIIGYNLPLKNLLENIINYINNILKKEILENEEEFIYKDFEDEIEFEEGKQRYENNLLFYTQDIQENIMIKNNIIKEIEENLAKGEKVKFYYLLLDDYLLTFICKFLKNQKLKTINNIKSFVKIFLNYKYKFNENCLNLTLLLKIFIWIELYSLEIISIIKMYSFMNSFIKNDVLNNLNEEIKDKISELNQEYENLEMNKNIKNINGIFNNIIGSLIIIFISNLNHILSEIKGEENLTILLDNLNDIYHSLLSVNIFLNLHNKEIYLLHETITVLSLLSFNDSEYEKKLLFNFIRKGIIKDNKEKNNRKNQNEGQELKNEIIFEDNIENNDYNKIKYLKNNLNTLYNYYKGKNKNKFHSLFSSILFDEFFREQNEEYRQCILKIILDDPNLIPHNILLIKIILSENIKPINEYIVDALQIISAEEIYFPLLNDCNLKAIDKYIMKIFESIINIYFDSLGKTEEDTINDLFDILKEYLKVISDKNYDKYFDNYCNSNLIMIYICSFIKIYLNKFVILFCDKKSSLREYEKKIINEIFKYSPITKPIIIYFVILIYNKTNSLELLKNDELSENIEEYVNTLEKEIGKNNFDNILKQKQFFKDDKNIFNVYFNYIKYPSLDDFVNKFISLNEFQLKYPIINEYIKDDSGFKNLKYLNDYNTFINFMINNYLGNISRKDASLEERSLNLEQIYILNLSIFGIIIYLIT